jgi:hypothetical protein
MAADESTYLAVPLPRGPMHSLSAEWPAISMRLFTHLACAAEVPPGSASVRVGAVALCAAFSDFPPFLAKFKCAGLHWQSVPRNGSSAKMQRLVSDLQAVLFRARTNAGHGEPADDEAPPSAAAAAAGHAVTEKAVVFSQHKVVIQHASKVLDAAGIRHVSICPGDTHDKLRGSVAAFQCVGSFHFWLVTPVRDRDCCVLMVAGDCACVCAVRTRRVSYSCFMLGPRRQA